MIKKIKFLSTTYANYSLVTGKVYDVIKYLPNSRDSLYDRMSINDDDGLAITFYIYGQMVLFEDVTAEYRSEVIDNILK